MNNNNGLKNVKDVIKSSLNLFKFNGSKFINDVLKRIEFINNDFNNKINEINNKKSSKNDKK